MNSTLPVHVSSCPSPYKANNKQKCYHNKICGNPAPSHFYLGATCIWHYRDGACSVLSCAICVFAALFLRNNRDHPRTTRGDYTSHGALGEPWCNLGLPPLICTKSRARAYRREHIVGPELQAWREKTKTEVGKAFARDRKPYEEYRKEMGRLVRPYSCPRFPLAVTYPFSKWPKLKNSTNSTIALLFPL